MLQPTLVHLNALVHETSELLTRVIGENIQIETVLASVHDAVHADPTQLEQILMNLAVNARDAMPTGGRLLIETADVEIDDLYAKRHVESVVQAGAYVMLAVSDTGTGIDERTRRRLFEPFFTTKAQGKGTGLGLATVYGIVKQSGGYVWVYSEQGIGSTFKVYLPRAYAPPAAATADRLSSGAGHETVLVVEDEEAVRFLARMVLERAGYRVLTASSPEEAQALFDDHADEIDLLISDVVMPGVSGPALFQRLKERRPSLNVLFVSGYIGEAIFRHHRLDATAAFVQKPFTGEGLVRKVREVLDARSVSE
jgi:CheY-like chemotaxis protein